MDKPPPIDLPDDFGGDLVDHTGTRIIIGLAAALSAAIIIGAAAAIWAVLT